MNFYNCKKDEKKDWKNYKSISFSPGELKVNLKKYNYHNSVYSSRSKIEQNTDFIDMIE